MNLKPFPSGTLSPPDLDRLKMVRAYLAPTLKTELDLKRLDYTVSLEGSPVRIQRYEIYSWKDSLERHFPDLTPQDREALYETLDHEALIVEPYPYTIAKRENHEDLDLTPPCLTALWRKTKGLEKIITQLMDLLLITPEEYWAYELRKIFHPEDIEDLDEEGEPPCY